MPLWLRALLAIGALMLLTVVAPTLVWTLTGAVGMVLGVLVTLFVYQDAQARRMPQRAVWLWTGIVGFTTFFACQYALLAFLLYLLVTRGR